MEICEGLGIFAPRAGLTESPRGKAAFLGLSTILFFFAGTTSCDDEGLIRSKLDSFPVGISAVTRELL